MPFGLVPRRVTKPNGKAKWEKQASYMVATRSHQTIQRVTGKQITITDLTSAEAKQIVGGYYLVEAKDFDAVQEIAQNFPDYDLSRTVEIREVMVFDH